MILHFLTDDKFSEYVLKQFASSEANSEFIVVSEMTTLKNISSYWTLNVLHPDSDEFKQVVNGLSAYNAIVLHGLFWPWEEFILQNVPDDVKVAWMFWGGEIYGRKDLKNTFLAPITKKVQLIHNIKHWIRSKGRAFSPYEVPKSLFQRIDYCLTDIQEEYQFARKYLGNRMKHLWYNYYSIEDTLGDAINLRIDGDNILLGNSGTIEGNYWDVYYLLKNKNTLKGRQIITPLSYGQPWVVRGIKQTGERLFKGSYSAIMDFLPRGEYNRILSTCCTVVMNHYRPQALGNIITSLWLGARVYMSKKSMQYAYLKRCGVILFSIEEDLKNDVLTQKGLLSDNDIFHNRKVLQSIYGGSVMKDKINELVKELDS